MSKTEVSGKQIKDGSIQRSDLDVSTSTKAVITKLIEGTGLSTSSTGVDAGTGDITVGFDSSDVDAALADVSDLQSDVTTLQAGKALDNLSDVVITNPSAGHVIQYNGTNWVNAGLPGAFSGSYTDLTNKPTIPTSLSAVSDVSITSPVSGQLLAYNGTNWVNTNTLSKDAAEKGLVLKGAESQTANLFEIQNSSSTVLVQFNPSGQIYSPAVGTRTLTVRGIASQTANLFEAKDGSNNTLFSVSNTGQLSGMNLLTSGNATYLGVNSGASRSTVVSDRSTVFGHSAHQFMTTGAAANAIIGYRAANQSTNSANLTVIGKDACLGVNANTTNQNAVFVGANALNTAGITLWTGVILGAGTTSTAINGNGVTAIGAGSTITQGGHAATNIGSGISYQNWLSLEIGWGVSSVGKIWTQNGSNSTGIGAGTGNLQQLLVPAIASDRTPLVLQAPDDMTANYIDFISPSFTSTNLAYDPAKRSVVGPRGEFYANQFPYSRTTYIPNYGNNLTYTISSSNFTMDLGDNNAQNLCIPSGVWTKWVFTNMQAGNNVAMLYSVYLTAGEARPYPDACSVNGSDISGGIIWPDGVTPAPSADGNVDVITFLIIRDGAGTVKVFGTPSLNFV